MRKSMFTVIAVPLVGCSDLQVAENIQEMKNAESAKETSSGETEFKTLIKTRQDGATDRHILNWPTATI